MAVLMPPINLAEWVARHRNELRPPVMNRVVIEEADDFIVMVVGGPNSRTDFHTNSTEELFYQLEGSIEVHIRDESGQLRIITIGPGELFLLPAGVPHSPRRGPGTVGLVVELKRPAHVRDGFAWYCPHCQSEVHRIELPVGDIVGDLKTLMDDFWASPEKRTCSTCGYQLAPPAPHGTAINPATR